ncbi:hypothetical protein GJAV_G00016970 [Gymnothorax javanicus]|nr:hypothetical protein GJAV_G00016970 [Gymnothorax javanicus]
MIGYADIHGDLLPINNDDNFCKAVTCAHPLLRVFLQRREEVDFSDFGGSTLARRKKAIGMLLNDVSRKPLHIRIGVPQDFRPVSSIIDVDILPKSHRRVRLFRHGSDKPLGFYIRDGTSVRVTPHGLEKVPGVFISRMVPGGLAESTGLLAVNDEVLEVNGIEVMGKSLDQVTDMMIANSHNLIITVKPANQRNNIMRGSRMSGNSGRPTNSSGTAGHIGLDVGCARSAADEMESDEDSDIIIERSLKRPSRRSNASTVSNSSHGQHHAPSSYLHRPISTIGSSNAAIQSQPSLKRTTNGNLSFKKHRDPACTGSPALRESNNSLQQILHSLRTDPRNSLALPSGAVEEDGTVITL